MNPQVQQLAQVLVSVGVPQEQAMQIAQAMSQAQSEEQMMQIIQQAGLNEQQVGALAQALGGGTEQPQAQGSPQGMPQQGMPTQAQGMPPGMEQGAPQQGMPPQQFGYGGRYYKNIPDPVQSQLAGNRFININPGAVDEKITYRRGWQKKNVLMYEKGGDFPPSIANQSPSGGDAMAIDYMNRNMGASNMASNQNAPKQEEEMPFTYKSGGNTYMYDPKTGQSTLVEGSEGMGVSESQVIERGIDDGKARERYESNVKSRISNSKASKIYGSDIEGKTEKYKDYGSNGEKPIEYIPKYAYDNMTSGEKERADYLINNGMAQLTGQDIKYKQAISISDNKEKAKEEKSTSTKLPSTPATRVEYTNPTTPTKSRTIKPIKQNNEESESSLDTSSYDPLGYNDPSAIAFRAEEEKRAAQADSLRKDSEQKKRDAIANNINNFVKEYKNFMFGNPIDINTKSFEIGKQKGVYEGNYKGQSVGDKLTDMELKVQNAAKSRGLDLVITPSIVDSKYIGIFSPTVKPIRSKKYYIGEIGFNDLEEAYRYIMNTRKR